MEIYPSGVHIKYIICKLIDFLHKACPWIDRCNKHMCRSLWILDARLITSVFISNKRESTYVLCSGAEEEKRDCRSEKSINNEKEQYLCGERRKCPLCRDSFLRLTLCWGLSYVSRYPTEALIKSSWRPKPACNRKPPAHSVSYQVTRLSYSFTFQSDTDAERSY